MVIIDQLISNRGDARSILNLTKDGVVEWSDAGDLARFVINRGINFNEFIVSGVEIGLNFVECGFNSCTFKNLRTDGHFWGAEDRWTRCIFERCELHRMIAPLNSFKGCRFIGVSICNFKPHQTLFDDCTFSHTTIHGLRAQLIPNKLIVNHEMKGDGQLLFRNCRFEAVSFQECYFEGVSFQRCVFDNTDARTCSFEGIDSDVFWWPDQKSDPFTIFLKKALDLIRTKCGRESAVYREFETYVIDYGSGRTCNKDFSACLYSNRVPYSETQMIIKDLRKLVATFPY